MKLDLQKLEFGLFEKYFLGSTVVGIVLSIIGSSLYFSLPSLISSRIKGDMKLSSDGPLMDKWLHQENLIEVSFYFFHVENPYEVERGEKVKLVEKGPYVFRYIY